MASVHDRCACSRTYIAHARGWCALCTHLYCTYTGLVCVIDATGPTHPWHSQCLVICPLHGTQILFGLHVCLVGKCESGDSSRCNKLHAKPLLGTLVKSLLLLFPPYSISASNTAHAQLQAPPPAPSARAARSTPCTCLPYACIGVTLYTLDKAQASTSQRRAFSACALYAARPPQVLQHACRCASLTSMLSVACLRGTPPPLLPPQACTRTHILTQW